MNISELPNSIPLTNGNTSHHSTICELKDDLKFMITSIDQKSDLDRIALQMMENILPIFIYIIDQDILSEENIIELKYFRSILPNEPIFFVRLERSDT